MLLDKFENKYIITGKLKALMPIHIGSGKNEFDPVQVDNGIIRDEKGEPYIPGSSLKGVLRSYVERLLNGGFDNKYKTCLIVNKPCLPDKKDKLINKQMNDEEAALVIYNKMCDVCKMFGSKHFASKIQISDARLSLDSKAYTTSRDGVAIDRDTGTAVSGPKFTFEVVSAGTEFDFYMTVDNLDEEHKDLLRYIVRILQGGELKIGGKTSSGLGTVKLEGAEEYKITKDNIKSYLLEGLKSEMRWNDVCKAV